MKPVLKLNLFANEVVKENWDLPVDEIAKSANTKMIVVIAAFISARWFDMPDFSKKRACVGIV